MSMKKKKIFESNTETILYGPKSDSGGNIVDKTEAQARQAQALRQ